MFKAVLAIYQPFNGGKAIESSLSPFTSGIFYIFFIQAVEVTLL